MLAAATDGAAVDAEEHEAAPVLDGTARAVSRRRRREALGCAPRRQARGADPQSVLRRLCRRRARRRSASRSICRRRARPARSCPISTRSTTRCSRARSHSTSPRRRTRRARSPNSRLSRSARRPGAALRLSASSPTNATARSTASSRRPACWKPSGPDFANVVVFHSLSKRSNLPGLRVGFAAGDRRFLAGLSRPAQYRGAAGADAGAIGRGRRLWRRGACARRTAELYAPSSILPTRSSATATATSVRRADSFSGSDVPRYGGSEIVTQAAMAARPGVRVVPGRYLARDRPMAAIPAPDYIRVAMVQDKTTTAEALHRLVARAGLRMTGSLKCHRHCRRESGPQRSERLGFAHDRLLGSISADIGASGPSEIAARAAHAGLARRPSRSPPGRCRTLAQPRHAETDRTTARSPRDLSIGDAIAGPCQSSCCCCRNLARLGSFGHCPFGEMRGRCGSSPPSWPPGFASTLPRIGSWRLPTGLGGVSGDALLRAPAMIGARVAGHDAGLAVLAAFGIADRRLTIVAAASAAARQGRAAVARAAERRHR